MNRVKAAEGKFKSYKYDDNVPRYITLMGQMIFNLITAIKSDIEYIQLLGKYLLDAADGKNIEQNENAIKSVMTKFTTAIRANAGLVNNIISAIREAAPQVELNDNVAQELEQAMSRLG